VLYVLEESLMKQLQNIADNMEEHRSIIKKLTNKNITLKHEEENISREMRGTNSYEDGNYITKSI